MSAMRAGGFRGIGAAALVGLAAAAGAQGLEEREAYFRLSGPGATEAAGLAADGTLGWTNAVVDTTGTVQRATDLGGSNWVDYTGFEAATGESELQVMDPDTPDGMAFIPEGWFWMGDAFGEGDSDELPVHWVYTRALYMDCTEVTKACWDDVAGWAATNGYVFDHEGSGKETNHPVQTVSWHDAARWCNARSEREGLTACYTTNGAVWRTGQATNPVCDRDADGYRLPTEAEWEKAARGGPAGMRFAWSATNGITHDHANYYSSVAIAYDTSATRAYHPDWWTGGMPYTGEAAAGATNGYGLQGMCGNVWEWCGDWYDGGYYGVSPEADPEGAESGTYRILRGGSWNNGAEHLRTAFRIYNLPTYAGTVVGFRCVRTAPQE